MGVAGFVHIHLQQTAVRVGILSACEDVGCSYRREYVHAKTAVEKIKVESRLKE
jgi:hypothetical protein